MPLLDATAYRLTNPNATRMEVWCHAANAPFPHIGYGPTLIASWVRTCQRWVYAKLETEMT